MRLVPSTAELVRAEIDDHAAFGRLLGATVPAGWPPGEAADALPWFLARLEEGGPAASGWYGFYGIVEEEGATPVLAGGGGSLGPPEGGHVEIGYSLIDAFQRRGYATEMMTAIIDWIGRDPRVSKVVAETDEANEPSRRLLARLGFEAVGTGREPRSLHFARDVDRPRS
jgi:ribosomal-protein-alanine N-acetyltransferase